MNSLPQELHFHIGLYLPFVEAHYFITSLYRCTDCVPFWKQYLIERFYIEREKLTELASLSDSSNWETSVISLIKMIDQQLKCMFHVKSYPNLNYFNNYVKSWLEGYRPLCLANCEASSLISALPKNIRFINMGPDFLKSIEENVLEVENFGLTGNNYDLFMGFLETYDTKGSSVTYMNKLLQPTAYLTPKGNFVTNFDIDIHYQHDNLVKIDEILMGEHLTNFTTMISEALMRYHYKRIHDYVSRS